MVELNVGVVIACMPSVPRMVRHHQRIFTKISNSIGAQISSARARLLPSNANSTTTSSPRLFTFFMDKTQMSQPDQTVCEYSSNSFTGNAAHMNSNLEVQEDQIRLTRPSEALGGIRTVIHGSAGKQTPNPDLSIHLRNDIRQETQEVEPVCASCKAKYENANNWHGY